MRRTACVPFLLACLFLGTALHQTASAQGSVAIDRLPLSQTATSLLGGRLTVHVPAGFGDEDEEKEEESYSYQGTHRTAFDVESGDESFEVDAQETLYYASGSLEADAQSLFEAGLLSFYPIVFSKSFHQGQLEIVDFQYSAEAVPSSTALRSLVKGAVIRMPDNTLVVVRISANKQLASRSNQMPDMAGRILRSLRFGGRSLDTAGHSVAIPYTNLEITCPSGYVYTYELSSFDLFYLTKPVPIGEEQSWLCLDFHTNFIDEDNMLYARKDTILGEPIRWIYRNVEREDQIYQYVVAYVRNHSGDAVNVDITIEYADDSSRKALQKAAKSLRFVAAEANS